MATHGHPKFTEGAELNGRAPGDKIILLRKHPNQLAATTRASIGHLPTELLLIIFRMVYIMSRYNTSLNRDFVWEDDDLRATSLFPYAFASVCPLWQDILASVPEFWTRLVIYVDRNPASLSRVHSLLAWSTKLPLDITVCRRDEFTGTDVLEGARVAAVMKLLYPHMGRWRSLSVNVFHATSLPCPLIDIRGIAPNLITLNLDSLDGRWDRKDDDDEIWARGQFQFFECPVLQSLTLDGPISHKTTLVDRLPNQAGLEHLTIAHYNTGVEPTCLDELLGSLHRMDNLSSLSFRDLDIHCTHSVHSFVLPDEVGVLTFERVSSNVIQRISNDSECWVEMMVIVECPITNVTFTHFPMSLTFRSISPLEDFYPTLYSWDETDDGISLAIEECPSFDSRLIQRLSCEDSNGRWACPFLSTLTISHCENVSSSDLRQLVYARHKAYEDSEWANGLSQNFKVAAIDILTVRNCGELREEDAEWFNNWRGAFFWSK